MELEGARGTGVGDVERPAVVFPGDAREAGAVSRCGDVGRAAVGVGGEVVADERAEVVIA